MPQLFCSECDRDTQHKSLVKRRFRPKFWGFLPMGSSAQGNESSEDELVNHYYCRECNSRTYLEGQNKACLVSQALVAAKS